MAKAIKKCKICGAEYEYCHSFTNSSDNVYRWQDVACSPKCGNIYFARILRSRGINPEDEGIFVDDDTNNHKSIEKESCEVVSKSIDESLYDEGDFGDEDDEDDDMIDDDEDQ